MLLMFPISFISAKQHCMKSALVPFSTTMKLFHLFVLFIICDGPIFLPLSKVLCKYIIAGF